MELLSELKIHSRFLELLSKSEIHNVNLNQAWPGIQHGLIINLDTAGSSDNSCPSQWILAASSMSVCWIVLLVLVVAMSVLEVISETLVMEPILTDGTFKQILPESQRTPVIEFITWIVSSTNTCFSYKHGHQMAPHALFAKVDTGLRRLHFHIALDCQIGIISHPCKGGTPAYLIWPTLATLPIQIFQHCHQHTLELFRERKRDNFNFSLIFTSVQLWDN